MPSLFRYPSSPPLFPLAPALFIPPPLTPPPDSPPAPAPPSLPASPVSLRSTAPRVAPTSANIPPSSRVPTLPSTVSPPSAEPTEPARSSASPSTEPSPLSTASAHSPPAPTASAVSPLITGNDGNFYGVTPAASFAGNTSLGTAFRLTPAGVLTTLYTFCSDCAAGYDPSSALLQADDGNFYGTTGSYTYSSGGIFELTPAGVLTLASPLCTEDCISIGPTSSSLTEGTDHALYGYQFSNTINSGSTYRLANGALTTLFSYCPSASDSCASSSPIFTYPTGPIFLAGDGNLYGTAQIGGPDGFGTIYSLVPEPIGQFGRQFGSVPTNGIIQNQYGNFSGYVQAGGDGYGGIYTFDFKDPAIPAAIQVSPASVNILTGQTSNISWKVLNATSTTMQQCIGRVNGQSIGAALPQGSYTFPSSAAGYYRMALTCGGIETAYSDVTVTASPTPTTTTIELPSLNSYGFSFYTSVAKQDVAGSPTGTVSLLLNSKAIETYPLPAPNPEILFTGTVAGIPSGNYTLTARYNGDAGDSPSVSAPVGFSVAGTTAAVFNSIVLGPTQGALTVLLQYMAANSNGSGLVTGSVTFSYHGSTLATAPLEFESAESAQNFSSLPAGVYPVTAVYSGDTNNPPLTTTLNITIP
jgi:uncharacterized repeat protein (TIGR03803 family)